MTDTENLAALGTPSRTQQDNTVRRLLWHLVPLLGGASLLQGLDQLNISFAGLPMRSALGFSASVFGLGSGMFFVTYTLFGIPSNLLLLRFGVRRWIAFLLCAFGPITAATALTRGPASFYLFRLLLGVAEGGFTPAVIYAARVWFPETHCARVLAWLLACIPIAGSLGAPISAWILTMSGVAGLQGWQWLFIVEGLPALFLAWLVFILLPDNPAQARWLTPPERKWLSSTLRPERAVTHKSSARGSLAFLTDPKVLCLAAIYFCCALLPFAVLFFLPQIIHGFGLSQLASEALSALPTACGAIGMILWTRHSDRSGERVLHVVGALLVSLLGAILVVSIADTTLRMVGLCLVLGGVYAFLPLFWTFPSALLSEASAAGGIALINAVGGLAGLAGPTAMGLLRDRTGSYALGLILAALLSTGAAFLLVLFRPPSRAPARPLTG